MSAPDTSTDDRHTTKLESRSVALVAVGLGAVLTSWFGAAGLVSAVLAASVPALMLALGPRS